MEGVCPDKASNPLGAALLVPTAIRPPRNIINSALANARMPLIDTGCPTLDDTTNPRTWGTIRRALHHDINRDQATWINQGSITIRVGGG